MRVVTLASYPVILREGTVLSESEPVKMIEKDPVEILGSEANGAERQVLKAGFLNTYSSY